MRWLLTNDDGIAAPGLAALERVCRSLGAKIDVVAPAREMSQVGHRVTTHEPIATQEVGKGRYAVQGTPADCVRLALTRLLDQPPDLVLSGINFGGNMGQDIHISGTVAGAREAAYHGLPAIAVSHYHRADLPFTWAKAETWLGPILEELLQRALDPGHFWNVNFPHLPESGPEPQPVHCHPERQPLPIAYDDHADGFVYAGRYGDRPRNAGTDVDVCFSGNIAVSRLSL